MGEKLSYDSEGNYHDDDVRLEAYAEIADIPEQKPDPVFVERVVDKIQFEIGEQIRMKPEMSIHEIKIAALNRLMGLIHRGLLTNDEGDAIYQRFSRMVNHYYGF